MINPKTITKIDDLKTIACQRRLDVLDMVFTSKGWPHRRQLFQHGRTSESLLQADGRQLHSVR